MPRRNGPEIERLRMPRLIEEVDAIRVALGHEDEGIRARRLVITILERPSTVPHGLRGFAH